MSEPKESAAAANEANTKPRDRGQKWVTFLLNETAYAVPAVAVDQITEKAPATFLPNSSKYLSGITPIRGEIAALIDLKTALGEQPSPSTKSKTLVLKPTATGSAMRLAFDVDRLGELRVLDRQDLEPAAPGASRVIAGRSVADGGTLMLLNCSRLSELLSESN